MAAAPQMRVAAPAMAQANAARLHCRRANAAPFALLLPLQNVVRRCARRPLLAPPAAAAWLPAQLHLAAALTDFRRLLCCPPPLPLSNCC